MMRAVVYDRYGPPDVLQIRELQKPELGEREVLVEVRATTVTSGDWHLRSADPFSVRLYNGLTKPRRIQILGSEFSGVVHSVGPGVTAFQVGDRVFGASNDRLGAHAEYLRMPEDGTITAMPSDLTWEAAASIPFGSLTALYFMRNVGKLQAGEELLVVGASGAVGSYSVQLAKHFGMRVTGVCSTRNLELVQSLGADHVIDYTTTDLSSSAGRTYDAIFDTVGKLPYKKGRRMLKPKGSFLTTSLGPKQAVQMAWTPATGKPVRAGIAKNQQSDMHLIAELVTSGAIRPVIDSCYPLEKIADAHTHVGNGRKRGSVVISPVHAGEGG